VQNGILSDKGEAMLEAYNKGEFKLVQLEGRADNLAPAPRPAGYDPAPTKDAGYRSLLE
jgi:hypothetical protein